MSNFLQEHYNRYRNGGGDHIEYAIINDLSDEEAVELLQNYESTHPLVPEERIRKFQEKLKKEAEKAKLRDDLDWLTGTGRFGQ